MESSPQIPNPVGTDEPLSFVNPVVNLRNSDVEATSVVQEPIANERSLLRKLFHFLRENKFFMVTYAVFLLLQLIGLGTVYLPRALVCCVRHKVSSYQCNDTVFINYELELELCWITAQVVTGIVFCCVVCKWHGTESVKRILHKLKKLPKFWCIMGMLVTSGFTMALMLDRTQSTITPLQTAILLAFAMQYLTMAVLVPLLNYTPIFAICRQNAFSRPIRLLVQFTLVLLFLVNLVFFLIGCLQLKGFHVSGIDSSAKGSPEFDAIFSLIRKLTDILFFHLVQSFLWTKIFCDDKNILSHMESLEPLTESD